MPFWYGFLRLIVAGLARLMIRFEVKGRENIPAHGNLMIIANHLHVADIPLVGIAIPRKITFLAKEELFHYPVVNFIIGIFDPVPINRAKFSRKALQNLIDILKKGGIVGIFPEGSRSRTGAMRQALPGVAFIARYSHTTILPVGVIGTDRLKGVRWLFKLQRVTINIGNPFQLDFSENKVNSKNLDESTDYIMHQLAELLPVEYRGYYGNKEALNG